MGSRANFYSITITIRKTKQIHNDKFNSQNRLFLCGSWYSLYKYRRISFIAFLPVVELSFSYYHWWIAVFWVTPSWAPINNVWLWQYRAIGRMKHVFLAMRCVYFSAVRICFVMLQYHIIHLEMWSRSKKYCFAFSQCALERIRIYNCATGNITENITECLIPFSSAKNGFAQTIKIDSGHYIAVCFNLFFWVQLAPIHWLSFAYSLKTQLSCTAIYLG